MTIEFQLTGEKRKGLAKQNIFITKKACCQISNKL